MRRLILVIMLLGSIGAACGQGMTSTTQTGGGVTVGTLASAFASPIALATPPSATATPTCAQMTPATQPSSPTAATGAGMPTPDVSGQYRQLTFAQAQQLAPFHLAKPAWLPPCLQVADIVASVPNLTQVQPNPPLAGSTPTPGVSATPPTGPVRVVRVSFALPNSIVDASAEFTVVINELKQGTPLGPVIGQDVGSTTTTMTIAGHHITRTTWPVAAVYPQSGPSAVYVWTDRGTTFQFAASLLSWPTTEPNVEHMIASMLQ